MEKISLKKSNILIGRGEFINFGRYISGLMQICKLFIITDENVSKIYLKKAKENLEKCGFEVFEFIIKPGEVSKSLGTLGEIYNSMASNFISKSDVVIGLGGGVVCDIAGFVAATYLRGINLIFIPTSFLAQIDASIGGKNGVNLSFGKNLVGTFYQPNLVLIDSDLIKTLPRSEFIGGISEAIKCGAIYDRTLFEILENKDINENIDEIIKRSIMVKKTLVEQDEFDKGKRMLLNFGHTIGHAIEKLSGFKKISHGKAVGIGMSIIAKSGESSGITEKGSYKRLVSLLKKYSLPTHSHFSFEKILNAMFYDKKISERYINLAVLKRIGQGFMYKLNLEKIKDFIKI